MIQCNDQAVINLTSDCSKCSGLCCTLLYCFKQDGFPENKLPGVRCRYLLENHQCSIHEELSKRAMVGCQRYDCIGAGPHILKLTKDPAQLLTAYPNMLQLHQIFLYLQEAITYQNEDITQAALHALLQEGKQATNSFEDFIAFDLQKYRQRVNPHLKALIKQLTTAQRVQIDHAKKHMKTEYVGKDLSMAFLVQKDFSNQYLYNTCFLGSDVRDVNIKGSDVSQSRFLTQMQINAMIGDEKTILPDIFYRPTHW